MIMQKTRHKILEYLREHQEATVEELSRVLDNLTAVTVRHHLDVLRAQGLITAPETLHRDSPGRPKYIYSLTEKAKALFPKNLHTLADHMLDELSSRFGKEQMDAFLEGVAGRMAADLPGGPEGESFQRRLDRVVQHLGERGYEAEYEIHPQGYVLHASCCPYTGVAEEHEEVCVLDRHYISRLLGIEPHRLKHLGQGDGGCSYLVPRPETETA